MGTKYSGKTGFVGASTAIAGINTWSLDYTVDALETTDFSASGTATYLTGVSRWSGTFGRYKDGAPKALGTSATVDLWLVEAATTAIASSDRAWHGDAYITGIHPTVNYDGIVSYTYDFQGTGSITVATS